MNISFSTCDFVKAKKYLEENFSWLNAKQHLYVLNNLKDIRVQDPLMYEKPQIEIHFNTKIHYKNIMDLT